ncbi:MAG: hypothetical protein ACT4PY_12725 [Armatimonadota bacterium]
MSNQINRRTHIALERGARRMHTRRRIMRNSWIAAAVALVAVIIGGPYYFGVRYPFIREWAFPLAAAAALVTMAVAVWLQVQMEGSV